MIERGNTPLGKMLQKHEWSEHSIAHALYAYVFRHKHTVVVPNSCFTGFEADMLVVREDLRLMDVEIKISRSDLKADKHKDKWLKAQSWYGSVRPPPIHLDWPRRIWKHYYAMPREIWSEDLLAEIPEKSGIILLNTRRTPEHDYGEYGKTRASKSLSASVKRQAKPNKDAKPIKIEEVMYLARQASDRMWRAMGVGQEIYLESPGLPADEHVASGLGGDAES